MKKLLLLLVGAVALSGCASSAMPVTGLLYGNVKAPLTATASTEKAPRVGRASARSILGIIASGDADTILGNQQVRDVYLGADFRL